MSTNTYKDVKLMLRRGLRLFKFQISTTAFLQTNTNQKTRPPPEPTTFTSNKSSETITTRIKVVIPTVSSTNPTATPTTPTIEQVKCDKVTALAINQVKHLINQICPTLTIMHLANCCNLVSLSMLKG